MQPNVAGVRLPSALSDALDALSGLGLRDHFLLRRDVAMLNHGSFGACPRPVFAAYQHWQQVFEEHPDGFMRQWVEHMDAARAALAAYLHTMPDQLAFVVNATFGVNVVAHSLRAILREGDQILTTTHEYAACNNAWAYVCGKTGARYIAQDVPLPFDDPEAWVEAFWRGVTPRTRVIFLSHITSPTALTLPVQAICRRAREAGLITVVDGAHVPGQRLLDLDALGADFYIGNCHKWMLAPKGSGFLFARREVQHLIEPLVVGHGWRHDANSGRPLHDYVEWLGTRDLAAFLAVPSAIAFMQEHDWERVRALCAAIATELRAYLEAQWCTQSLCTTRASWFAQMVAIRLPDSTNLAALSRALRERYRVEVPLIEWRGLKLLRVSVQAYTTRADIERLVEALLEHGG